MTSYRYGYVRVSTLEQDPASQLDAMAAAGVDRDRVFLEHASGALDSRPELTKLVKVLRAGDTLVVWRLDRLGRSPSHLIQTVTELGERGVGFHSFTGGSTPRPRPAGCCSASSPRWPPLNVTSSANAPSLAWLPLGRAATLAAARR